MVELLGAITTIIATLIGAITALITIYFKYIKGADIELVFREEDESAVLDMARGGMAIFEGYFINNGNKDGNILNTTGMMTGLYKKYKNEDELILLMKQEMLKDKMAFAVPGFHITMEPKAPLGPTIEPKKNMTPYLLKPGDQLPFKIVVGRTFEEGTEQWLKEHSGTKIKIRIYYTVTTRKGPKTKCKTLKLEI